MQFGLPVSSALLNGLLSADLRIEVDACSVLASSCSMTAGNTTNIVGPVDLGTVLDDVHELIVDEIADAVAVVVAAVADEVDARLIADAALRASLEAETAAREDADQALEARVDQEAAARAAADAALSASLAGTSDDVAVAAESAARASADDALSAAIASESAARVAAVNAEVARRASAVAALESSVASEGAARASADTTLHARVDAANGARASGDQALQSNLDALAAGLAWVDGGDYIYAPIGGEVTTVIGAQNLDGPAGCHVGSWSQSFTAEHTGVLASITFNAIDAVSGVEVRIFDASNDLVHQQSGLTLAGTSPVTIGDVAVVAGQVYVIQALRTSGSGRIGCSISNPYAGGAAAGFNGIADYYFRVVVAVDDIVSVTPDGYLGLGTSQPTARLDVAGDSIRIRAPRSPAASAACATGELAWDADHVYVCVATNSWRRAALTTY